MSSLSFYTDKGTIYPGQYTPLPGRVLLVEELRSHDKAFRPSLPVNITECRDHFRIEVAVPGSKREDILVHIKNATLFVTVIHPERTGSIQEKPGTREFDADLSERLIPLPRNADTEFISAEYRSGVLVICIPKDGVFARTGSQQVIVY